MRIADHIVIARRHAHIAASGDIGEVLHEFIGERTDIPAALTVEKAGDFLAAIHIIVAVRLEERVIALGAEVDIKIEMEPRVDRIFGIRPLGEDRSFRIFLIEHGAHVLP